MKIVKPCPFCGHRVIGPIFVDCIGDSYSTYFWIECTNCPCSMEIEGEDEDIALSKWNRRVNSEDKD